MEKILRANGLPKETDTAIMVLYKNTKAMNRSSDGDTGFFNIVTRVLPGDILVPYLFVLCLNYVFRMSINLIKESIFTLKTVWSRQYPTETMIDADDADDLELPTNAPSAAEF